MSKFSQELKKQVRMAITAAVGFLIAFSWRDYIFERARNFLSNFPLPEQLLFSSLMITLMGVLIIVASSKILE